MGGALAFLTREIKQEQLLGEVLQGGAILQEVTPALKRASPAAARPSLRAESGRSAGQALAHPGRRPHPSASN